MLPARILAALLFPLLFNAPAGAQRSRGLECPRPARQRVAWTAPRIYAELGAGFSKPLLYRNAAGAAGDHHRFNSLITPYATAIGYLVLGPQLEVFAGAGITQSWQGLRFSYEDRAGSTLVRNYAGSLVATLPVGIRYRFSRGLRVSAGPYLSYSSHSGTEEKSGSSGGGGRDAYYNFSSTDHRNQISGGLRLAADIRLSRRLAAVVSLAADAGQSAASYGTADLSSRSAGIVNGQMQPYLLHAGLGLSYKLWYREDE